MPRPTAILSRRLKEMEALGLVERVENKAAGNIDYFRTEKAIKFEPAMNALSEWSQCNIEAETALSGADALTIMWAVRRMIVLAELPRRRAVIRFHFRDDPPPKYPNYWFVVEPGADFPELCSLDPGRDVDLYVETGVVSLGAIIEGRSSIARQKERGGLFLSGDSDLARSMNRWLRTSVYAGSRELTNCLEALPRLQPHSAARVGTYVSRIASPPMRSLATRRSGGRGPAK